MTTNWRGKLILLTGATLIAAGLFVIFTGPGAGAARAPAARLAAAAAPASRSGDNGTVKIHNSTTPVADPRNEPHVCVFYLDAFGFDAGQAVAWWIQSWPPTGNRAVVAAGTLTTDGSGDGHTGDMTLPDGHYKLFWTFAGEHGRAKHKVFWVSCGVRPTPPPTSSPTPSPAGPVTATASPPGSPAPPPTTATPSPVSNRAAAAPPDAPGQGGLPITGWPLALIAGTGVALLGGGATVIVIARRRRGLHSR